MRHWLYPRIRARIIGPFLIVTMLVAVIGVFTITRLVAGSIQERFSNQLADSASAASNSAVDIERQQLATLRLMTFTDGVPNAILQKDTTALERLVQPVAANARLDDVIVFDAAGESLLQLRRVENETGAHYLSLTSISLKDWHGIQQVIASNADQFGDKFVDLVGRAPDSTLYISAPVKDASSRVIGGISVGITTARLAQRISAQSLSAVTLFAKDGQVLSSTFHAAPETLTLSAVRLAAIQDTVQYMTPLESVVLDGVPYQALYVPFQVRNERIGLLAVALPSNFIVERSSTSRDILGILFSGLFACITVVGLVTARTVTAPVAKLVTTTRAIREGDLSRRVQLRTPDELGELGTSFDHMTDQLVQRNVEINQLYEQQLQETARRDAVLSSISDAVIVQDPAQQVILHNPTAAKLVQLVKQDVTWQQTFIDLFQRPTAKLVEPVTVSLGGRAFSVLATPVNLPSGEPLGRVIVFRDITAIVEAENLKDELVLQMSHELRTPLTAARGYLDLVKALGSSSFNEQISSLVTNAAGSLVTLERMINQVIDISAMIANRFTVHFEIFDLAQMLHDLLTAWNPVMGERNLTLSVDVSLPERMIEGSAKWLSQVVDHILRNAYSYTLPGGKVGIRASVTDSHFIIEIADNGTGIGPDEIDKVFNRMFRGRSAEAGPTDARGLGLGLYIAQQVIEAHHGTIRLESELDQGTTVTLELPKRQNNR